MKIALAQMKVAAGNPEKNVKKMLEMIEKAKKEKVDLIAFPELCVGGYLLGDAWTSEKLCKNLMRYNKKLIQASTGIAIAYGNVFYDDKINERTGTHSIHPNRDGRVRKYNAVYVFQNGEAAERVKETKILPKGVQPKTLHPTYRIFDDDRYFFSNIHTSEDFNVKLQELMQPFLIEVNGKKVAVGFEICEDLWCEDYRKELQALNPTKMLTENGAKYVVNISASPWTYGKNNARDRRVMFLKKDIGNEFVPFIYVNCTGVQNNGKNFVTFDGGSTIYNKEGMPVLISKGPYQEELIIADDNSFNVKPQARNEKSKIEQKYLAIIEGLKAFKDTIGSENDPRVIIGLSGGIDSSLVAALLVEAYGKDKIIGVNMPSIYNSKKTKDAASYLAHELKIKYQVVPIDEIVNATKNILDKTDALNDKTKLSEFHMENVQARTRGSAILAGLSAKYGAIFTNNGNKLETALGYATLYGDVGGAIAPIADLTKIEVVEMAKFYNTKIAKREVIPNVLLPDKMWNFKENQIKPSAELKEKQIDPMKFVYHCAIIDMMTDYKKINGEKLIELFIEGKIHLEIDNHLREILGEEKIGLALMKKWGVTDAKEFVKDLEWFERLVYANVFKRIQAPPIIITSKSSYGFDIRESMLPFFKSERREELEKKAIEMKNYNPMEDTK